MKLRISGGYSDYVRGGLVDALGHDLSTATLKLALIPEGQTAPGIADSSWKLPDAVTYPAIGQAEVRLLISEAGYTLGRYLLWVLPLDNPTATPVAAAGVVELV